VDARLPGAPIPLGGIANLRDLGGWTTPDGRLVRHGLVYRSAGLGWAEESDIAALADLGIRTVYDLRSVRERSESPDRLPAGAAGVVVDVLGDQLAAVPAHMLDLLDDPPRASVALRAGVGASLLEQAYRDFVTLPSAHAAYRRLFTGMLDGDRPAGLVHCTTGKDRTGWAAAVLLLVLGVPEDAVYAEYLLTNAQLLPALAPLFARFAEGGGDPEVLRPVLGVQESYLRTALDLVRAEFGTVQGYVAGALGLDAAWQERARATLLVG
jgi:protein-tyrosine phosphatase